MQNLEGSTRRNEDNATSSTRKEHRRFQTTLYTSAAALPTNTDERLRHTRMRTTPPQSPTTGLSVAWIHETPASDDRHSYQASNSDAGPTSTRSLRDEKVPGPSQRETRRAIIQHHSFTGRNTMTLILSVSLTLGRECCSDPTIPRLRDSN
ncbi:hypothetical protein K0M31_016097 [Melipona bicolor]|uniref:Uncharacterized protein n=1 Tax=Melipona bicolor TaxID=60889 RepID=A0AA40KT94_9HYME|nr:hypothetical protein K0M31_016097 [Melipona bicolor]